LATSGYFGLSGGGGFEALLILIFNIDQNNYENFSWDFVWQGGSQLVKLRDNRPKRLRTIVRHVCLLLGKVLCFINLKTTVNHCIQKTILSKTLFIIIIFTFFKIQTSYT